MHTVKLFPHASGSFHEGETATHTGYVAKHPGQVYGGTLGAGGLLHWLRALQRPQSIALRGRRMALRC
jgi:hypothetical protein